MPNESVPVRIYRIREPVYNAIFVLVVGEKEQARKELEKRYGCAIEPFGPCSAASVTLQRMDNGQGIFTAWMGGFDGSPTRIAELSHELLHNALSMLRRYGVREEEPNECVCYMHSFLLKTFLKKLAKDATKA